MSTLRQYAKLNRPEPYLAIWLLLVGAVMLDASRPPQDQITARAYVGAAHIYQDYGRPVSKKIIRCRYQPTCSEYSVLAVERFGLLRGLKLTWTRLSSCTTRVPYGTVDPVPLR